MNVFLILRLLRLPCLEHGRLSSKPSKLKLLHDAHEVLGASLAVRDVMPESGGVQLSSSMARVCESDGVIPADLH
jgi:hypothetical protein